MWLFWYSYFYHTWWSVYFAVLVITIASLLLICSITKGVGRYFVIFKAIERLWKKNVHRTVGYNDAHHTLLSAKDRNRVVYHMIENVAQTKTCFARMTAFLSHDTYNFQISTLMMSRFMKYVLGARYSLSVEGQHITCFNYKTQCWLFWRCDDIIALF